jgi:TetR/AcrR family transcriptional regulator
MVLTAVKSAVSFSSMDGTVSSLHRPGPPRSGIAERIWDAARAEFSTRGYHGARVQGIARGAACNVALIYRHWSSKKALYLDILRSVWLGAAQDLGQLAQVQVVPGGAASVVGSFLDAMLRDPTGAQILIREYLDGAPHLAQLAQGDPSLVEPVRRAAAAFEASGLVPSGIDPLLAVVTVGGLAALVASTREAARPFLEQAVPLEAWRRQVNELLLHGLAPVALSGAISAAGTALT